MRPSVRSSYKTLLRASRDLFGEDLTSLTKARTEIRSHYLKNSLVSNETEISRLVSEAQEAEEFIAKALVQAKRTGKTTFAVQLKDPDAIDGIVDKHVDFEPLTAKEAIVKAEKGPEKKSGGPVVVMTGGAVEKGRCKGH